MIDLSYKPRKDDRKNEDDAPMGLVILAVIPFAVLLYVVLTASFLHGIY